MKFQVFVIFVFMFTIGQAFADSELDIKVDIVDDSVSSEHFSDEMDVRRPRKASNEHALPELEVQDALWKKAGIEEEIKDYDLLAKDKLYFYLDELEVDALLERFPEISEKKMRELIKLRRAE